MYHGKSFERSHPDLPLANRAASRPQSIQITTKRGRQVVLVEGNRNIKMWQHQTAVAVDIHHTKRLSYWNSILFCWPQSSQTSTAPFFSEQWNVEFHDWKFLPWMWTVAPIHFESLRISLESARFVLPERVLATLEPTNLRKRTCCGFKRGRFRRESFHNLTTCHWKSLRKHHNNQRWKCHKPPGHHWWGFPMDMQHPPIHRPEAFQKWEQQPSTWLGIVLTGHPWYHNSFQRHHWCVKTWNEWNLPDSHRGGRWKLPPNG